MKAGPTDAMVTSNPRVLTLRGAEVVSGIHRGPPGWAPLLYSPLTISQDYSAVWIHQMRPPLLDRHRLAPASRSKRD